LNLLKNYIKKIDVSIEVVKKKTARAGKPAICKQGCYFCCKESVYCYKQEASHALHGLGGELLKRVKERTREWVKRFTASGMADYDEPPVVEYRRHNIWCPFLEDGKCSVYDRRPIPCRLHLAVGPLEKCVDDELRREQLFVSDPKMIIQLQVDVAGICQPAKADHLGVWLAELLLGQEIKTEARLDVSDLTDELMRDPNREQRMKGAVENYVQHMKKNMNGTMSNE